MKLRIEEDHPSIVVQGGFDPQRFQPEWFRAQKLLGAEEAERAKIRVIAPQVVDWSTDGLIFKLWRIGFKSLLMWGLALSR